MKNKISDKERLLHILDAINIIQDFSKNISFEQYSDDLKLRLALVKLFEIIGEAKMGFLMKPLKNSLMLNGLY